MIFIVNAENRALFEAELIEMHRQRKEVFVDEAGWRVPVIGDMEIDRYDSEGTTYLISKAAPDSLEVTASVRLLPTTTPHLMSDLFLDLCCGSVPRGPAIWEVSRFCVNRNVQSRRLRLSLLWEAVCGVMETALLFGVEQITFVACSALLPLTLDCGWQATPLGPTLPDGDDAVTAVIATITPDGLRTARRRFGIASPVTRFAVPACRIAA
jgi:acyl-homoserine lactone synthase